MAFQGWDVVPLGAEAGNHIRVPAPVVMSASRRTDIPAFHAEWFVDRLRAGHVRSVNPFSGTPQYISFAKTRAIVFWTKNPKPILPHLAELDRRGVGYYFQFTLNNYEREGLEPGVPPLQDRIATFQELSQTLGRARVVWRADPLLLADGLDVDQLAGRVAGLGEAIYPHTEKLVIAFADIERYAKVRARLRRFGKGCRELAREEMRTFAEKSAVVARSWGLAMATCAEALDLKDLGVEKNRCIDDRLLARLFPGDAELLRFLGPEEVRHRLKDKGQRKECRCIVSADIGAYETCPHLCRYCYANSSVQAGAAARTRHGAAVELLS